MQMTTKSIIAAVGITLGAALNGSAERQITTLKSGWEFTHGRPDSATVWQRVRVPHDWAIYGPFDREHDLYPVAIEQNGERIPTVKTARSGGLPFIGQGTYRTDIEVADTAGRALTLLFDGAMSNARVMVNGREVAKWPYGYNSFYADISKAAHPGRNTLVVELENFKRASRWYPGAGLYRNVHLIATDRVHIPVWGTHVTTPDVTTERASVRLESEIAGLNPGERVDVATEIIAPDGSVVARNSGAYVAHGQVYTQNFLVDSPQLWSTDTPHLYHAVTRITKDGRELDRYDTRFGIRKLEYLPERGFLLNGVPTKFRGVCNHHDLGPLGAAVNRSALRHQLEIMKDMGVNALRTSHNMPAPELVELCDEMGVMLMVESFDDWGYHPKSANGYGRFFKEWAERDITNMVKHYRNNPSVVMWSIGNEVPSQRVAQGIDELTMMQSLVKSLDTTRPVTCGMDRVEFVIDNGFAAALDIPGFNYKPWQYEEFYAKLPQRMILATESASTVSSRGVYHFPMAFGGQHNTVRHPDHQSSSYDNETCNWSNTPDIDFLLDEKPWVLGQFVWTGFDYLGEPAPYDTDAWPSHSSLFGIVDLASLPKDRYYLYRSVWNKAEPTLHILPHWSWPGREGEQVPVFVYTSYPRAELFINGVSQGIREKNDSTLQSRYRLMWPDAIYRPGSLRVVAYDSEGRPAAEKVVRTSGKPHHLVATPHKQRLTADGEDLLYITVQVADKEGNIVPTDTRRVKYRVDGAATFEATANGDPTSLLPFHSPEMDLFSGAATAIVRSAATPGTLRFTVTAPGLRSATLTLPVR